MTESTSATEIQNRPKLKAQKYTRGRNLRFIFQGLVFSGFVTQGFMYYLVNFKPLGNLLPFLAYQSLGYQVVSSALIAWGAIFFLTLIFGRFVCGWLCPIGFLQDAGERVLKFFKVKLPKPTVQPRFPRYLLAAMILVQFVALPILASPVRIWKFDLHYQEPWLLGFPFHASLFLLDLLAIFFVIGIVLPYYFGPRPYCKMVCETGLILDRFSQFSFGRIRRNHGFDRDTCITCGKCTNNCPQAIDVAEEVHLFDRVVNPECIGCLDCVNICPNDTIVYSLRKRLQNTGKVAGYLAGVQMKPEDLPRYLLTSLGVLCGGYVGFIILPPSYFHTYLILSSIGGFVGWIFWKTFSKDKKISDVLKEKTLSQAERESSSGLSPLANREKMAYVSEKPTHKWIGAGLVFSSLILSSLILLLWNKVPPRILSLEEISGRNANPDYRAQKDILNIGIPQVLSLDRLQIVYGPWQHQLNHDITGDVRLVTSESYGELANGLENGKLDMAILPPMTYLSLQRREDKPIGFLQVEDKEHITYQGLIISRSDGPKTIDSLERGLRIAFTSIESASGYAAPMALLKNKGYDSLDFSKVVMSGNHLASLQLLQNGKVDLVATYEGPLSAFKKQNPEISFNILATIPEIPTDVVVIRNGLSNEKLSNIKAALLSKNSSYLEEVGITGFTKFDEEGYMHFKKFLGN